MRDIQVHLEKLRVQAAECEMIRDATDKAKREVSDRLAQHFKVLANELEREIAKRSPVGTFPDRKTQERAPNEDNL
jgi:hypothetical protein